MANDLFGGLGDLIKGFSEFIPQDDPDVKLMNARSEVNSLQNQEIALYAEIGKLLLAKCSGQYPDLENKLKLVQTNLVEAQERLKNAKIEKEQKEQEKQLTKEQCTCLECGYLNIEGTKFCQECGAKLGAATCQKCGAYLVPGTRFCGECGAKMEV